MHVQVPVSYSLLVGLVLKWQVQVEKPCLQTNWASLQSEAFRPHQCDYVMWAHPHPFTHCLSLSLIFWEFLI